MSGGVYAYATLGLSLTHTCPFSCAHCIVNCGPAVEDEMSTAEAFHYIGSLDKEIGHISFTGGEPFLNLPRLEKVIKEAKRLGYAVSVMTCGFWAGTPKRTHRILQRLQDLGLDMMGVSLDRFHLEFVGEDRCVNICQACASLNLPVSVRVLIPPEDHYGQHVREMLRDTKALIYVNHFVRCGRARSLPVHFFRTSKKPFAHVCETIKAVNVSPGGNVYACCGPMQDMHPTNPLVLGNALTDKLSDILRKGLSNPFMKVINTRGPVGLFQDLQEQGYANLVKNRRFYTDACQLCLDICNSAPLVRILETIYADPDIRRTQNAAQFKKIFHEYRKLMDYESRTGSLKETCGFVRR